MLDNNANGIYYNAKDIQNNHKAERKMSCMLHEYTKEVPQMAEKKYTTEALEDAEQLAKILANVPRERKPLVTMMASAFIAGAEAQAQLTAPNGSTRQ